MKPNLLSVLIAPLQTRGNTPKTFLAFCKKCSKHNPQVSLHVQGKPNYDGSRVASVGRLSPRPREEGSHRAVCGALCVELTCRSKRTLAMQRQEHCELGGNKKRKGPHVPWTEGLVSVPLEF